MKTIESEEIMLQVGSALVSLDVIERFFVCDLEKCLGACCIEGDAGAPVSEEECRKLKEILCYPKRSPLSNGKELPMSMKRAIW